MSFCAVAKNVPFVRLAKIELKKSAVGKNKKYRRVGNECRVICLSVSFFITSLIIHFIVICLVVVFSPLVHNGRV
jgi:hypothetical protein